jgi:hypothetical protein
MPSQKQSARRVLLSGMFDMRNFGDLMFPLIARQALEPYGYEIVPVSPSGHETGFDDAMDSISLAEMMAGEVEAQGIAIGGGYMIHTHKMHFLEEYAADALHDVAGPGLWLGATLAAAIRDVPIAWNAPGVPHPFASRQRPLIAAALRAADYVSLRDRGSLELLEPPADAGVWIVPDPVAGIAKLWPRGMLSERFKAMLQRKGAKAEARTFALHFRNRSLARLGVPGAAQMIDTFAAAEGLAPILLAVGQTHADDVLAREIGQAMKTPHILLDDPSSLIEIAAAIAGSALYIGASLHGYVTAAAYGMPGILVAQPSYRKFQGFLDHTGRHEDLAKDWPEAFGKARTATATPLPDSVPAALDRHWECMAEALASPQRKRAARQAFLQACERDPAPAWAKGLCR